MLAVSATLAACSGGGDERPPYRPPPTGEDPPDSGADAGTKPKPIPDAATGACEDWATQECGIEVFSENGTVDCTCRVGVG